MLEKPTKDEVIALASKLRMQRYMRALFKNAEDEDFLSLPLTEQCWETLKQVESELEEVRTCRYIKKSGVDAQILRLVERDPKAIRKNRITDEEMQRLASSIAAKEGRAIVIIGSAGSGKSSVGTKILSDAMHLQCSAVCRSYSRLIPELCINFNSDRRSYEAEMEALCSHTAVMLDDCFLEPGREYETTVLSDIINRTRERGSTLILTSDLPTEEWYEHFDNAHGAEKVLDRILKQGPFKIVLISDSLRSAPPILIGGGIRDREEN